MSILCPHWISLKYLEKGIYRCCFCGETLPYTYLEMAKEQTTELNNLKGKTNLEVDEVND